jgi:hypothetical protein
VRTAEDIIYSEELKIQSKKKAEDPFLLGEQTEGT